MADTKYKVLLIEDDKVDQMAFKWLVTEEKLPYHCIIVESVNEARQALCSTTFDAVVVDYLLRDGTAFDLFDSLGDMPIIVTTGAGNEEIAIKAIKAGACDYLIKDFERNYLKAIPVIIDNVIKRKKLEEIIEQKQKNLEAIFDAVPVGMLLVDEHFMVKRVNDAIRQTVNKEYAHIINRPVGEALRCVRSRGDGEGCAGPQCVDCPLRGAIETALNSGQSVQKLEAKVALRVDKKEVTPWLWVSVEPVMIDKCKHAVVAIDDITDHKEAQEKLRETMELKSQFVSTVSHELRTPLGCIKEGIDIILEGIAGKINGKQREFLDLAKRNVDRLSALINDVLDFQKLEAGRIRLNVQTCDIKDIITEVYQTMCGSASRKDIDFSLEFADGLGKVEIDRDKIVQVLINLVSNAIKFSPEQGAVSIRVQFQSESFVLQVSDTGMGIPKQALSKIFERFYRVQRPGEEIQGTGLGLAIVKKIVEMHGGRIEVESREAEGSTFSIFLPLKTEPQPAAEPAQTERKLEKTRPKK
jgi:hypothetical protein